MEKSSEKFAKRLRAAMKSCGYEAKPSVLEREFNLRYLGQPMTLHGVRRWLLGESLPKQDKVEVLAEWLCIPPQQLRYGVEIEQRIEQQKSRWEDGIGYREREVFEAFLALPPTQRKVVREVIQAFSKAFPAEVVVKHPHVKKH